MGREGRPGAQGRHLGCGLVDAGCEGYVPFRSGPAPAGESPALHWGCLEAVHVNKTQKTSCVLRLD